MNLYGLDSAYENSKVIVIPVPWEGTVSYGRGTADAPEAIFEASPQIDLCDPDFGPVYKQGIFMLDVPVNIKELNRKAYSGAMAVNELSAEVNGYVHAAAKKVIHDGKIPIVLGGEHSVSYGAIVAVAGKFGIRNSEFGILHLDAHFDLRNSYEGFTFSHASAMYNVIQDIPQIEKLVSVGVRDFCEEELAFASANKKIKFFLDNDLALAKIKGESWFDITERIICELPQNVWVSFDIDVLDPSLAPHTGTPVPGGLSFYEANHLLRRITETGRRIVGADLCEVVPGKDDEWDANVGMRVLYKLFGWICSGA